MPRLMTSMPAALRSAIWRSIAANRYGGSVRTRSAILKWSSGGLVVAADYSR